MSETSQRDGAYGEVVNVGKPRTPRAAAGIAGKKARTRTGCWNCRRRRKKCNERRPACGNCLEKGETCEWGIRLSFRDDNVQTLPQNHPSMRQDGTPRRDGAIKIVDITNEVIRDYQNEVLAADRSNGSSRSNHENDVPIALSRHRIDVDIGLQAAQQPTSSPLLPSTRPSLQDSGDMMSMATRGDPDHDSPASINTSHSYDMIQSAAVQLLDLTRMMDPRPTQAQLASQLLPSTPQGAIGDIPELAGITPEQLFADDGIFLPGSAYLELHSALRHHIFDTARSTYPSRSTTPDPVPYHVDDEMLEVSTQQPHNSASYAHQTEHVQPAQPSDTTPITIELTKQEEYVLWKNWVDEIALWLDKFDHACHFAQKLPALAKVHSHVRFSMLALSARQMERKSPGRSSSASLALYQEAVHQLVPQLQTKSTEVVASCVVLCVLEMMSCSPQMWRRHLDGCACLIQALGINGFSGGMEQALFWCFARMDVCGGLISSESTLIPASSWTPGKSLTEAVELFRRAPGCDMYANLAVFLCAQMLELFACEDSDAAFTRRWNELFAHIEAWYSQRPSEMRSILSQPASTGREASYSSPFPTLLFSNPPAISGNQLYHTAALLMLQKKPRRAVPPPNTRPILWHARRICAISICNTHHGCWTNSVQPLWIAGQVMSHHAEHRAILETYERIERETGWGTDWRANDLKAHWADLDDG